MAARGQISLTVGSGCSPNAGLGHERHPTIIRVIVFKVLARLNYFRNAINKIGL